MYVGVLIAWLASRSFVARSTRSHAEGREEDARAKAAVAAVGARPRGGGRAPFKAKPEGLLFEVGVDGRGMALISSSSSTCGRGAPAEKAAREDSGGKKERAELVVVIGAAYFTAM